MKRSSLVLAMSLTPVLFMCTVNTGAYADSARLGFGAGWHDAGGLRWTGPRFRTFAKRIAGLYLVRSAVVSEDDEVSMRLVSLTADGNWFGTHSDQHDQQNPTRFSDQHGVWKRSGPREITAEVLDFDLDPSTGKATGVVRVRFVVRFNWDLRTVTGEYVGQIFALDQDPFDPDAVPIGGFDNTFTGHRLTVDLD